MSLFRVRLGSFVIWLLAEEGYYVAKTIDPGVKFKWYVSTCLVPRDPCTNNTHATPLRISCNKKVLLRIYAHKRARGGVAV